MKFTKFGKALLLSALSAGLILGVTSCIQSYGTGYLYVTGTNTSQPTGVGIISGFVVDHNTGKLFPIHGLPVSSGGANPGRFVLTVGSKFIYVLNQGVTASGSTNCTTASPCQNSNITQFAVGGNGILTAQETFYTQGINPFRIMVDGSGSYLYVLDHDSPDNYNQSEPAIANGCTQALTGATTCGDITAFSINPTTGRLSLIQNAQVKVTTTANGTQNLTYFPVPANPIDFVLNGSYVLSLYGTPASGDSVFFYATSNGQLTITNSQPYAPGTHHATAIVVAGSVTYILDNEAPSPNPNGAVSQILPYNIGTGTLTPEPGGSVPDDPTLSNPNYILQESKGKFLYLVNQGGNPAVPTNPNGGLAGYVINSPYQLTFTDPSYFGTGSAPQCIVEDPSAQFIYTANNDSTVTGRVVDPNAGVLTDLRVASSYALQGPAAWCVIDSRTN